MKVTEINFEKNVRETLAHLTTLLTVKAKEYVRNDDPYYNFNKAAQRQGKHPLEILDGYMLKHEVSISDITEDLINGKPVSKEQVIEKFNDNIAYLLIKKSIILDALESKS